MYGIKKSQHQRSNVKDMTCMTRHFSGNVYFSERNSHLLFGFLVVGIFNKDAVDSGQNNYLVKLRSNFNINDN